MKKNLSIAIAVIIVLILAGGAYYLHSKNVQQAAKNVQGLNASAYPLYTGASWDAGHPETQGGLSGYSVTSLATSSTNNISSITKPFEQYYQNKLTNGGWSIDNALAADGAGSSLTAYQKDGIYIVIGYTTTFDGGGVHEPVQCPCHVTLGIFSGSVSK